MSKYFIVPNEPIKKNRNDDTRPRKLYPNNLVGSVLYGCILKYLSSEEITKMNLTVLIDSRISVPPLERFILENYITQLKSNPKNPDDFIIYNYLVFNDQVKTKDLIKKYYDKNIRGTLRDILPVMNIKISTPRKFKGASNSLQMKLEF